MILLRILQGICAELEAKRDINPLYLGQVIEFMKIFVDKFHNGKEEDLLFPAMRKAGVRREPGPIGELMIDHIKGRSPRPSTSTLAADRITERGSITRGKSG
jgi:hemerythrin-like domain-containing protein